MTKNGAKNRTLHDYQKSEALNSKPETISKLKIQMTETAISGRVVVWYFEFWLFEFVSGFVLSISDLILLKVERLAREGELDTFGFKKLHNLEIDPLIHLVINPVVRRLHPVAHIDIERPVIKIAEIDPRRPFRVRIYLGHFREYLFYYLNRPLSLFGAGAVSNGNVGCPAYERTFTYILDVGIGDCIVGYRNKMTLQRPDSAASKADSSKQKIYDSSYLP